MGSGRSARLAISSWTRSVGVGRRSWLRRDAGVDVGLGEFVGEPRPRVLQDQFACHLLNGVRVLIAAEEIIPVEMEVVAPLDSFPGVGNVNFVAAPFAFGQCLREPGNSVVAAGCHAPGERPRILAEHLSSIEVRGAVSASDERRRN